MYKIEIIQILDKLGFIQEELDQIYNLTCYTKDEYSIYVTDNILCVLNGITVFNVKINISVGTFLVLLQEYQLIHERYIYETIEGIVDRFYEDDRNWKKLS